jgi:phospholipid/cholesterol/gamma-HCH transport system permease protein
MDCVTECKPWTNARKARTQRNRAPRTACARCKNRRPFVKHARTVCAYAQNAAGARSVCRSSGHLAPGTVVALMPEMELPFAIDRRAGALRLTGELRLAEAAVVWRALRAVDSRADEKQIDLDLSDVAIVDGAIMALLVELRATLVTRGIRCEIVGASERVTPLVHLYGGDLPPVRKEPKPTVPLLERAGRAVAETGAALHRYAIFVGELAASTFGMLRRPSTSNLSAALPLAERAGIDGVPIVLLLNFLVGVVMAYQSSEQLRRYGANVYVADVVGISATRELAPLMTAIIMCGRSGASFAAELGSMKVAEEIDALRTLGFSPVRYLILPRVVALVLVAPVLTLLADVVAVIGGAIVGVTSLDVTVGGYFAELTTAISAKDVWTGVIKSVAFAAAIALIGCQQGFATSGGAAGVGKRTTSTVVTCLFTIVILDSLLTIFFRMFRL